MYHNKKLNITNFDTITGLVIHSRWEAEYQGFNEKTYRFNFTDNNVPWNYSFIEMELEKKIVGSSCALNITYYTSPTTNPYKMMTWVSVEDLRKGPLFAGTLVKLFTEHFM